MYVAVQSLRPKAAVASRSAGHGGSTPHWHPAEHQHMFFQFALSNWPCRHRANVPDSTSPLTSSTKEEETRVYVRILYITVGVTAPLVT